MLCQKGFVVVSIGGGPGWTSEHKELLPVTKGRFWRFRHADSLRSSPFYARGESPNTQASLHCSTPSSSLVRFPPFGSPLNSVAEATEHHITTPHIQWTSDLYACAPSARQGSRKPGYREQPGCAGSLPYIYSFFSGYGLGNSVHQRPVLADIPPTVGVPRK
jgi:hypothetical protein